MRKCVVLSIVAILAVAAAGAFTPADAKGKKGTKGAQQQQYLQIKMQDALISSYRTAPSTGKSSTARPSGASRR